jgi:clan AA aspartic protease
MIEGLIRETGTPVVTLHVFGSRGDITVEGILDTGFDGFLCLPIPLAVTLGLELIDVMRIELADGTVVENELVFTGRAEWDETVMNIDILLTRSADVLIGTGFLQRHIVELDYNANTVKIEKALLVPSAGIPFFELLLWRHFDHCQNARPHGVRKAAPRVHHFG